MSGKKRTIEELLADTCEACHKTFKTHQGLCAHQSMSQGCAWYKKGKLRDVFDLEEVQGGDYVEETMVEAVEYVVIFYPLCIIYLAACPVIETIAPTLATNCSTKNTMLEEMAM